MWLLYLAVGFAVFVGLMGIAGVIQKNRNTFSQDLREKTDALRRAAQMREHCLDERQTALDVLAREKCDGFPWLAKAYADFCELQHTREADELEYKSHPAPRAAEAVRKAARRRIAAERAWRICRYKLEFYEALFPWLVEFQGEDIDDLIKQITDPQETADLQEEEGGEDPVRHWVTKAEYETMSICERNQLALDRYWHKKKTRWEIGRDFERFVGYLFEAQGWEVRYQGIVEGLSDLGRDLICKKNGRAIVVQCKYWSQEKQIHEKHIFQLHGTLTAFRYENPDFSATGLLVTSTKLSDKARRFAKFIGLEYWEEVRLEPGYPCIKCNVSHRDGTRIYHLPFDQQYDRTLIDEERHEFYASTVQEAEAMGFRRAYRWQGVAQASGV